VRPAGGVVRKHQQIGYGGRFVTWRCKSSTGPQAKSRPDEQESHRRQVHPGKKATIFKAR